MIQKTIDSLSGIGPDALASTIITLVVFILGFIINGLVKLFTDERRKKNARKLFFELCLSLRNDCTIQVAELDKSLPKITIESQGNFTLIQKVMTQLPNILKLEIHTIHSSIFNSIRFFFNPFSVQQYHSIWSSINLVNETLPNLSLSLEKFNQNRNHHNNLRNNVASRLASRIEGLQFEFPDPAVLSQEFRDSLNEMTNVYLIWSNIPEGQRTTPFVAQNNLILPLLEVTRQPQFFNKLTHSIQQDLLQCDHQYREMENWTNLTASAFTKYRDSFQSAATMLTENIPIKK